MADVLLADFVGTNLLGVGWGLLGIILESKTNQTSEYGEGPSCSMPVSA